MNKIINYFKESKAELSKVTWPSREQAIRSTILVIVVSVATAIFLGGTDYLLNLALERVLVF